MFLAITSPPFSQCFYLQPRNTAAFSGSNSQHLLPRHEPNSTPPWSARAYSQEEKQSYPVIKPLLVQLQNREMLYIKQIFQYLFTSQYKDNCPYKITDSATKTSWVRRHKGLLYDKASEWHSPFVWLEACFLHQVFSPWLSLWLKANICSINHFVRKKEIHLNVYQIPKLFSYEQQRGKNGKPCCSESCLHSHINERFPVISPDNHQAQSQVKVVCADRLILPHILLFRGAKALAFPDFFD